ncbi:MAG: GMC oxidoreductase, partial [Pseudomonadota bacterium]
TVQNGLKELYDDPRVTLMLEAEATAVDVEAGVAKGVRYKHEGEEKTATGDCVVLAANAIFNPHILLASGLDDGLVGKRLHEQGAFNADVDLDGIDNFQGSTSVTGLGYMLYDGDHRREAGAALLETWNVPAFRTTPGKWRQKLQIRVIVEDLPTEANYVALDAGDVGRPRVHFDGWTSYFSNGVKRAKEKLPEILAKALPVEAVEFTGLHPTEAHIQGTTMMGDDAAQSVVDRYGLHHHVRNLVVLGSSLFPTSSPANPTLTLSAMALLTGERL